MTPKQKQEIDFLCKTWNVKPTNEEKEDYIKQTVLGGKTNGNQEKNCLFQAKRRLDISIKQWREDLCIGILSVEEMKTDFNHPYFDKVMTGIIKGIRKDPKAMKIIETEFLSGSATGKVAFLNKLSAPL